MVRLIVTCSRKLNAYFKYIVGSSVLPLGYMKARKKKGGRGYIHMYVILKFIDLVRNKKLVYYLTYFSFHPHITNQIIINRNFAIRINFIFN